MPFPDKMPVVCVVGYDCNGNAAQTRSPAVTDPANVVRGFVTNGGSPNLAVNGSSTPVVFTFDADPTNDIAIDGLRWVGSCGDWKMLGDNFAALNKALDNGLLLEIKSGGAASFVEIANITYNEQLVEFASPGLFTIKAISVDLLTSEMLFGGTVILTAGSADQVKVTVRDNCSLGFLHYLSLAVRGVKV